MALVTTPAVVLRTYRYSETSKIVRLATRDLGIQSAIAKGALRPKSRFGAGLELLSEGTAQLYFRETRELHTLAAFDLANLRRDLAAEVGRFAGATVLAEVMLKMAPPAPLPAAYDVFTAALDALAAASPDAIDAAGVRGIWLLLGVLGFEPSLGTCVRDGTTIDPDGRDPVTFSVAEGGVACPTCTGPAADPAAAAGVPGPPRPERRRGGPAPARRATRRRPPPARRPLRPAPLRRGRRALRPRLLGASCVVPHALHASPVRRFVIGTAGHIDHGKTALVKALTGVDTDRWEEEKRRGITIDLGFAPLPLPGGIHASVVDVPGHEGFVKNMLAGATGVDVALLVIAADEGIMPQTEEHLAIIELLGVRRGIPVITKRDLVDAEWLELVRGEVSTRLGASRVRWDESVATSVVTGEGLADLRDALRRVAGDLVERPADDLFRLPIDRVFAVAGAGTVVTGSTWSGSVRVGDIVQLLPLGREARVRSIEVHGQTAERAVPGRRTALALVGVDKSELTRGHVAVTGPGWQATELIDVAAELLPTARKPLASRTRVRVH